MNTYRSAYCTLNSIIQQLNADDNDTDISTTSAQNTAISNESANTQAYYKRLIREVSAAIASKHNRVFVSYDQTLTLRRGYMQGHNLWGEVYEYRLRLPDDILSITSITWVGTVLTSSEYRLADENAHPNIEIAADRDAISTLLPADFDENVTIVGAFGYHRDPDNMWLDSGDTVQDSPLSSSDTTLNVTSGGNFEVMQHVRIESEYLLITAIVDNALTVERGVNGSTKAAHVSGKQIDKFVQTPEIEQEARRLAIRHFHLRGGIDGGKSFIVTAETAIEIDPNDVKVVVATRYVFGSV